MAAVQRHRCSMGQWRPRQRREDRSDDDQGEVPGAARAVLQLNDSAGNPMVEAGNTGSVGVVRTGPLMRMGGMAGLPATSIRGKAQ